MSRSLDALIKWQPICARDGAPSDVSWDQPLFWDIGSVLATSLSLLSGTKVNIIDTAEPRCTSRGVRASRSASRSMHGSRSRQHGGS